VPIDHALFRGIHARVLVRSGRPLAAGPSELLDWILARMPMFAPRAGKRRTQRQD
jgi:hypothetical protein